jgi:iron complex outermembrane receptor protein
MNDYQHKELEGAGEIGSRYEVSAWESRVEAIHQPVSGWRGVIGLQLGQEDFTAVGEEVFAPGSDTEKAGLFVVEEREFTRFTLQGGARLESVSIEADGFDDERFNTVSVSLGAVIPLANAWELGLVADLAQRAPVPAELYSEGPHLATQSFEIGDPDLDVEQARNLAATLRYRAERVEASATLYFTRFQDFIYQADTGEYEDDLPVRVWAQDQADFLGLDLEARFRLLEDAPVALDARVFYDFVDAELDVSGPDRLPRLPPDRAGVGLEARWQWLTANVDYLHAMEQDQTAAFELETPGYDDLRAQVSGRFDLGGSELTLFVQGRNLTDDEQRNHVSFIKDYAPLPGRSVLAGMRLAF